MLKIHLKSGASVSVHGAAYGYGRVYTSLKEFIGKRSDIKLVDNYKQADIQVCLTLPARKWKYFHWWGKDRHPVKVCYTMWETTIIPLDFAEIINDYFSALFVPSSFCLNVFKNCGVRKPIYTVRHGVDIKQFPYFKRNWDEDLIYLWQGMNPLDRKGLYYVEEAWKRLNLKNAILVKKTYPVASKHDMPIIKSGNTVMIYRFLNSKDYKSLLMQCHVSVNPFRGEGFGLMPLETAATGMATIVTNWSGATEYLNNECFRPLKYKLCPPGQDFINSSPWVQDFKTPPAQDAIPDVDDLCDAMLQFYENRDIAREMGIKAHEYVKKNWTWEKAVDEFIEACKTVLENAL